MGFWILWALWLLSLTCIPHLLLLNKRPTATLAWLWAILLFPVLGAGLYLAIGSETVRRRRQEKGEGFRGQADLEQARTRAAESASRLQQRQPLRNEEASLLRGLATITDLPTATATSIKVLYRGAPFYAALKEDIARAKHEVHIELFIWRDDEVGKEFLELLCATARRGVQVRLLLDELGCFWLRDPYFRPLIEAGGEFSWCHTLSPLRNRYSFNLRNHRKLQIIDRRLAFVGGMNLGREYLGLDPKLGDWADMQLRVEGSVVDILHEVFSEDWYFATGQDIPPGSAAPVAPDGKGMLVQVLRAGPDEDDHVMLRADSALVGIARERLWISTGYFVPGETTQTSLQVAAAMGVDVRLLVSSKSQHPHLVSAGRSYYDALLRQGVRIFEYSKGIDHTKSMVIDRAWSTVGSSNLDERSLRLNFELSLLVHNPDLNSDLARIFEDVLIEGGGDQPGRICPPTSVSTADRVGTAALFAVALTFRK